MVAVGIKDAHDLQVSLESFVCIEVRCVGSDPAWSIFERPLLCSNYGSVHTEEAGQLRTSSRSRLLSDMFGKLCGYHPMVLLLDS